MAAHTVIATTQSSVASTGRKADVICAAYHAAEAAHRLIKPGKKNNEVTEAMNKIVETFKCSMVEGVLSHQMKRFVIDGNKTIISKTTVDHKVEEFEFEENQIYCVDVVVTTGEGKVSKKKKRNPQSLILFSNFISSKSCFVVIDI